MSGWVASMGAGGSQAGVHEQCQALCAPRGTGTLSSLQAPVLSCEHRDSSQHAHVHAQYGRTQSPRARLAFIRSGRALVA